jgi:predicted double-glycine peptidase
MVTASLGYEVTEIQLEEMCETSWLGNICEELAAGAQKAGFEAEVIENITKGKLKELLWKGIPVIALVDPSILYGGVQGFGHFVVIVGLKEDEIIYHDPDLDKNIPKDAKLFFNAWRKYSLKGVKIWRSMKK